MYDFINSDNAYGCQNMAGNKPIRDPGSVWYVSEDEYPGDEYPSFCSGGAYLIRSDVAAKIYSICNQTKLFWIDDVFVTGILRDHYNIHVDVKDTDGLELFSMNSRYNLSKLNKVLWCHIKLKDPMKYTFVTLENDEIVRNMFCIWKKIRFLKYIMNNAVKMVTSQNRPK